MSAGERRASLPRADAVGCLSGQGGAIRTSPTVFYVFGWDSVCPRRVGPGSTIGISLFGARVIQLVSGGEVPLLVAPIGVAHRKWQLPLVVRLLETLMLVQLLSGMVILTQGPSRFRLPLSQRCLSNLYGYRLVAL